MFSYAVSIFGNLFVSLGFQLLVLLIDGSQFGRYLSRIHVGQLHHLVLEVVHIGVVDRLLEAYDFHAFKFLSLYIKKSVFEQ